jgi:CO/xanthine dehydrogenase Mo-binding subunit
MAAISNAVAHALGVRIRETPFTREKIAAALMSD